MRINLITKFYHITPGSMNKATTYACASTGNNDIVGLPLPEVSMTNKLAGGLVNGDFSIICF